ncbi:YdhR family protein [Flavitalea flava]
MSKPIGKVFLYGEFQLSVPSFTKEIWVPVNEQLKGVKGLVNKTWLLGIGATTAGGFYEFDSVENARAFATGLYAEQAKSMNASLTVKIFDGDVSEEGSRGMRSPFYD